MSRARALLACLALSCGCGHPRLAAIAGTSTLGAVGVGLPLAHECTPQQAGDCDAARVAMYLGVGAIAGALLGWWVYHEWLDDQREAPPPPRRTSSTFRFDAAGAIVDLPGSPLGADAEGSGTAAACVAAKRAVVESLEARCGVEGFGPRLAQHTVIDEPCACVHDVATGRDACTALADATCAAADAPARVLAFATTSARAEADAAQRCVARDGAPGEVTSTCGCNHDACGCVAEVACAP